MVHNFVVHKLVYRGFNRRKGGTRLYGAALCESYYKHLRSQMTQSLFIVVMSFHFNNQDDENTIINIVYNPVIRCYVT